jgi:hypothetical protein
MYPLVEFPELVKHYAHFFEEVFSAEALIEFERYISGLIVSENKTVEGINRLFVNESRNQSSLNRLLTESPFSLEELNEARLRMLASLAGTAIKPKGVLGVDDTLLIHYGQEFEKIAQLFDHVSQSYVWAHDLVTIHYSDDETDYPAEFQLWEPVELEKVEAGLRAAGIALKASKEPWKEADPKKWRGYVLGVWRRQQKKHEELRSLYDTKLILVEKMLSHWVAEHPDAHLPVTFDNWFTQPEFCRFLDEDLQLAYVGTLASTDKVNLKTGQLSVGDFAERLKQEHLAAVSHDHPPVFQRIRIPFKGEHEIYYSYCNTHRLHNFGQQRLVVNYRQADLSDNPTFYLSNRLIWQAAGITRIRRHRWPVDAKRIMRKARPKDWTSTNCGTSAPFSDMSPWSPWSTRYCAPPNMTLLFTRSFIGFFTSIWKTVPPPDVERLRHNLCGAWVY